MKSLNNVLRLAMAGAIAMLGCQQGAVAAVTMKAVFSVHNIAVAPPEGAADKGMAIPADTKSVINVTLAGDWFEVKTDDTESIYDFKARRRYVIDLKARTYVEYSLYDVVGFRDAEYANRVGLQQMMSAAKINTTVLFSKAGNEQAFSVEDKTPSAIDCQAGAAEVICAAEQKYLARWSTQGSKVGADDMMRFVQFMRYTERGHPQILARLADQDTIPLHLAFNMPIPSGSSVQTLEVTEVKPVTAPTYDLHGYARRHAAAQERGFADLLDRAQDLTAADLNSKAGEIDAQRNKDVQEGHLLPAVLGTVEWGLVTGQQPKAFTPEQLARINADADVKKFLATLAPRSKEDMKAAADTLAALREQVPQKSAVLAVLEANDRAQLGDPRAAAALFRIALQANPELTGAYKDLGDFLYGQFVAEEAWRSWDAGRRLVPQFRNFKTVDEFESKLVTLYPVYFQ